MPGQLSRLLPRNLRQYKRPHRHPYRRPARLRLPWLVFTLVLSCVTTITTQSQAAEAPATIPAGTGPQLILLKADDFKRHPHWQRFTDYILANNMKASIGIICNLLERDDSKLVSWTHDLQQSGAFDFWHHGYDHRLNWTEGDKKLCEFSGTSYEYQKDHYERGFALVKEKLGIELTAFGAPGNAVDETTVRVLAERPELKAVFYGPKVPGKIFLERRINAEQPTGRPNSEKFTDKYRFVEKQPYLVLQLHPGGWQDADFTEFVKIIDFLKSKNVRFVTTAELCEAQ